jgi:hypothetical protein
MTKTKYTATAHLGRSDYGNQEPQLLIAFPTTTKHREKRATLYELAAQVERETQATRSGDRWIVQVAYDRIYLELDQGDAHEARVGLELLQRIAKRAGKYKTFAADGSEIWVTIPED